MNGQLLIFTTKIRNLEENQNSLKTLYPHMKCNSLYSYSLCKTVDNIPGRLFNILGWFEWHHFLLPAWTLQFIECRSDHKAGHETWNMQSEDTAAFSLSPLPKTEDLWKGTSMECFRSSQSEVLLSRQKDVGSQAVHHSRSIPCIRQKVYSCMEHDIRLHPPRSQYYSIETCMWKNAISYNTANLPMSKLHGRQKLMICSVLSSASAWPEKAGVGYLCPRW